MGEVIATRAAYGKALVTFGGSDPDLIVLDADLAGATMTNSFAKAYPAPTAASRSARTAPPTSASRTLPSCGLSPA